MMQPWREGCTLLGGSPTRLRAAVSLLQMTSVRHTLGTGEAWPPLQLDHWRETYDTLHLWTQIVGKTRLALAPMENHWWQVALYVTPRGLTTSAMPFGTRTFEVELDFIEHRVRVRTSDG